MRPWWARAFRADTIEKSKTPIFYNTLINDKNNNKIQLKTPINNNNNNKTNKFERNKKSRDRDLRSPKPKSSEIEFDVFGRVHVKESLVPAATLSHEINESEGRLLEHLAVDPVEREAEIGGAAGEVGILGERALETVVEADELLHRVFAYDERAFEIVEWTIQVAQAEAQCAQVAHDALTVRQRVQRVLYLAFAVRVKTYILYNKQTTNQKNFSF